jgi:hypothetical protein
MFDTLHGQPAKGPTDYFLAAVETVWANKER